MKPNSNCLSQARNSLIREFPRVGGGAVDLVMHVYGIDFKTAVRLLEKLNL
jgi:hypothetical protein